MIRRRTVSTASFEDTGHPVIGIPHNRVSTGAGAMCTRPSLRPAAEGGSSRGMLSSAAVEALLAGAGVGVEAAVDQVEHRCAGDRVVAGLADQVALVPRTGDIVVPVAAVDDGRGGPQRPPGP